MEKEIKKGSATAHIPADGAWVAVGQQLLFQYEYYREYDDKNLYYGRLITTQGNCHQPEELSESETTYYDYGKNAYIYRTLLNIDTSTQANDEVRFNAEFIRKKDETSVVSDTISYIVKNLSDDAINVMLSDNYVFDKTGPVITEGQLDPDASRYAKVTMLLTDQEGKPAPFSQVILMNSLASTQFANCLIYDAINKTIISIDNNTPLKLHYATANKAGEVILQFYPWGEQAYPQKEHYFELVSLQTYIYIASEKLPPTQENIFKYQFPLLLNGSDEPGSLPPLQLPGKDSQGIIMVDDNAPPQVMLIPPISFGTLTDPLYFILIINDQYCQVEYFSSISGKATYLNSTYLKPHEWNTVYYLAENTRDTYSYLSRPAKFFLQTPNIPYSNNTIVANWHNPTPSHHYDLTQGGDSIEIELLLQALDNNGRQVSLLSDVYQQLTFQFQNNGQPIDSSIWDINVPKTIPKDSMNNIIIITISPPIIDTSTKDIFLKTFKVVITSASKTPPNIQQNNTALSITAHSPAGQNYENPKRWSTATTVNQGEIFQIDSSYKGHTYLIGDFYIAKKNHWRNKEFSS